MNAKLALKVGFLILVLLLLVVMGMNNRQTAQLSMRPILAKPIKAPAALMYFGFFAVGVLSATFAGAARKGGSGAGSGKSKAAK
jgi:uncharacterized integral membrane protein